MSHREIPLKNAIERLLSDSRIADVELEGDDGVRLPGCKALLAARSEVFERMLLGEFCESTDLVVKVGYPGNVLKKVVRYCYTDEIDLTEGGSSTTEGSSSSKKEYIHQMLLLADAANYFELSQLRHRVVERAKQQLTQNPEFAMCYFEQAKCIGCTEIMEDALVTIQSHLPSLLSSSVDSIYELSHLSLMEILEDSHCPCEERYLYQLLEVWAYHEKHPDRLTIASEELSKLLHLELIPASILESQVTAGGLIQERSINLAYKEQAKLAEKTMELLNSRSARRWKSSRSTVFQYHEEKDTVDFLQTERLSSGIYEWTIVVESLTENMFLGVEGGKHDFWLGYNGVQWRDKVHYGNSSITFRAKSEVKMTLDLIHGGILTASVNDSKPEIIFTKMLTAEDSNFVPAACIKKQGSVRFGGLRRLA